MMRNTIIALAAIVPMAACNLDIPDLNNPPEDDLRNDPSPELVRAAATGLLIGHRTHYRETSGYISQLGVIGREAYNFDGADNRYRSELLSDRLDGGSRVFGGNFWEDPYANIHLANLLLEGLEDAADDFSAADIEAIRGFAKTIQALDYLIVINTHDENGAAVVTSTDVDVLPPLVTKDELFDHIETLLDEGQDHLANAGGAFPFPLSSGFTRFADDGVDHAFDVPATFIRFNRAIAARVAVYRGEYAEALTHLQASFIATDAGDPQLELGVYNAYGTGSGDSPNELVANYLYVHPSVATDIEDGDLRLQKTRPVASQTLNSLTSNLAFTIYPSSDAPIPIIRNEELILLRAEANFELGNLADAIADIDFLRQHSAGLPPRTDLTMDNFFDELVYQRRYGLLFEGHRWIDMRRWGLLGELPIDRPMTDAVATAFPIPTNELNARE
jgi:starch-binding outer membrane protein, SusD/RagB family